MNDIADFFFKSGSDGNAKKSSLLNSEIAKIANQINKFFCVFAFQAILNSLFYRKKFDYIRK